MYKNRQADSSKCWGRGRVCSSPQLGKLGQRRPVQRESAPCTDMTQGSRAFLTVGLPLFALTVSGFYGLSHLVQGKYDVQVGARPEYKHMRQATCTVCISMKYDDVGCRRILLWQAQRQKVVDLKVDPEKQKAFSLEQELQVTERCLIRYRHSIYSGSSRFD